MKATNITMNPIEMNNPLKRFPSKSLVSDSVRHTYIGYDMAKTTRQIESKDRWLQTDSIDPTFGIKGNNQEVHVRRSYRRMNSSTILNPPKYDDVSLSDLNDTPKELNKKYILVESSRLEKLEKVENILRDEKERLSDQCSWLLSDRDANPHIPTPAIKMAVHNSCDKDMRFIAKEMKKLTSNWKVYCINNKYHDNSNTLKESLVYNDNIPLVQRAMKLKLLKVAIDEKSLQKDRDNMMYEDELSSLVRAYIQSQDRRLDYDRYYVLATRYGSYHAAYFHYDSFPGKRYYNRVVRSAKLFQGVWGSYWAVRKVLLFRMCQMIQRLWRFQYCYKKWHPLIKIRMRFGPRSYYMFCMTRWKYHIKLLKYWKGYFIWYRTSWVDNCFLAWIKYTNIRKDQKAEVIRKFVNKMLNASSYMCFNAWAGYSRNCKRVRINFVRMVNNPFFDTWIKYTAWSKRMKFINNNATNIQKVYKGHKGRILFLKQKDSVTLLCNWIRALKIMYNERLILFNDSGQTELMDRRFTLQMNMERKRLQKLQDASQLKEYVNLNALKKYLMTKAGRIKLNYYKDNCKIKGIDKIEWAKAQLCEICINITQQLERHEQEAKTKPYLICPDPNCRVCFMNQEQFENHLLVSSKHDPLLKNRDKGLSDLAFLGENDDTSDNTSDNTNDINNVDVEQLFGKTFALLCVPNSIQTIEKYLIARLPETQTILNSLRVWTQIQEWRSWGPSTKFYFDNAYKIYRHYLSDETAKVGKLSIKFDGFDEILKRLSLVFEIKDKTGLSPGPITNATFFKKSIAPMQKWRGYLGLKQGTYLEWTDETTLAPVLLETIAWHCLLDLTKRLIIVPEFINSNEYKLLNRLVKKDLNNRNNSTMKEYKATRRSHILGWSIKYHFTSKNWYLLADKITESVFDNYFDYILAKGVENDLDIIKQAEQKKREKINGFIDDVLAWLTDDLLVQIWEYDLPNMIDMMGASPVYKRDILVFMGEENKIHQKKLLINLNVKSESRAAFNDLFG